MRYFLYIATNFKKVKMSQLRIGTCSWKYDSWKGLVYSDSSKPNYLKEYSDKYNTVEIDQWFWSLFKGKKIALPRANVAAAYGASVPENFRFTIKMPNSITLTHFYDKDSEGNLIENPYFLSEDVFASTIHNLWGMKEKIAFLMFQFEYLNKQKMPSIGLFIDKLKSFMEKTDPQYRYAIEIRNPNYLQKEFFQFLKETNITPVLLQGYYMPPIDETIDSWRDYFGGNLIIRLHGPDRSVIEGKTKGIWNKIVEPKDAELLRIMVKVKDLLERGIDIYLNVNNHYEGSAPLTIEKIRKLF